MGLEPPLLQQATFDDVVYEVDVVRNVAAVVTPAGSTPAPAPAAAASGAVVPPGSPRTAAVPSPGLVARSPPLVNRRVHSLI